MQARFLWRALKARWRDQRAELSIIRDHIKLGDTVCDVGAHKGNHTYWLSRALGRGLRLRSGLRAATFARGLSARSRTLA